MLKELLFVKQEPEPYKKNWEFKPEWMITGLNTPVCVQLIVDKQCFTMGKGEDNDGVLRFSPEISSRHITLNCSEDGCFVTDEGSTNGTFHNGIRIASHTPVQIKSGDNIQLATSLFLVERLRTEGMA